MAGTFLGREGRTVHAEGAVWANAWRNEVLGLWRAACRLRSPGAFFLGWKDGRKVRPDGEASSSWGWNGSGTQKKPSETLLSLAAV